MLPRDERENPRVEERGGRRERGEDGREESETFTLDQAPQPQPVSLLSLLSH